MRTVNRRRLTGVALCFVFALFSAAPSVAQDVRERSDVRDAIARLESGQSLSAYEKALLDESGYVPEVYTTHRSGEYGMHSLRPGQSATLPTNAATIDLLVEDFATGIPATWSTGRSGAGTVNWAALTNASYGGGTNMYVGWDDDAAGDASIDHDVVLQTPAIVTTGHPNIWVRFDYSYRKLIAAERFGVEFSTDGGTVWQTGIADLAGTVASDLSRFPQTTGFVVALPAAAGNQADLRIRFRYDDGSTTTAAWNWFGSLDNVVVQTTSPVAPPACAVLVEPTSGTTGMEGLILMDWDPGVGDAPTGYKLFLGTDNPPTNIANGTLFAGLGIVLSGAVPNTTYFWRIVPTNAAGDATGCPVWQFTTKVQSTISSFPYVQDFETSTTNPVTARPFGILSDWYNRAGGSDFWRSAASADAQPTFGASTDHTSGAGRFAWLDDSQAPIATNAQWWMPVADLTTVTGPRLRFWYQNVADGNATEVDISTLNVLVSTNGGATFSTALTVTERVNAWTQYFVDLTPFASAQTVVAFSINEHAVDFNSDPSLDDVVIEAAPTTAVFSLLPNDGGGAVNLGTAAACAAPPSQSQVFTIQNVGVGTLSVTGASIAGPGVAHYSLDATNLPASLGAGESVTVTVTFAPATGTTGVQLAQLTVNYNDGSPDSEIVDLTATASDASLAFGSDGGYAFRSTVSACTAGSTAPAPTGSSMIPVTSHTRIVTWTTGDNGDDSSFTLDAATLDALIGSVLFFGRRSETIHVGSNGFIAMTTASTGTGPASLPTTTGGGLIAAASMDLDTDPAVYGTDNTGQFGAPGVFYGLADADGDGGTDDLVVTWWHAYDFGSPVYPAPDARYFTAQAIIIKADQPNANDHIEIRFPDGNDANGVPFRHNTSLGGSPVMESDVIVGVSANTTSTGGASEYHENAAGAPIYPPGGTGVGVRFTAETQAMAVDEVPGWRMMAGSIIGPAFTVASIADLNLVQGVTNQYPTHADNVYSSYDGTAWVAATSTTTALTAGRGFIWYLYDMDLDPPNTDGTSNSYALPMPLQSVGAETSTTVNRSTTIHDDGDGWNIVGNPWRMSLDVSGLASWAVGGALASGVGQVWDPATGSYVTTTTLGNILAPWQGMMIQNTVGTGATSISVPPAARTTGGVFQGFSDDERMVAFELQGTRADNQGPTTDRAAVLYFHPDATPEGDLFDAGKLHPLADRFATIAFMAERDGETVLRAQESRPRDITTFEVPLGVSAVGTTETLVLRWPTFENVPEDWTLILRDLVTGSEVDLRQQESYTFTVAPTLFRNSAPEGTAPALGAASLTTLDARFVLSVSSATTGTSGGTPTVYALHAPAPNPVSGPSALVRFDLPEASDASVEVYDMLGRRVATLAEGAREAGRHAARLETSSLASGVYVVRMRAGDFVQAQRVTVSR